MYGYYVLKNLGLHAFESTKSVKYRSRVSPGSTQVWTDGGTDGRSNGWTDTRNPMSQLAKAGPTRSAIRRIRLKLLNETRKSFITSIDIRYVLGIPKVLELYIVYTLEFEKRVLYRISLLSIDYT